MTSNPLDPLTTMTDALNQWGSRFAGMIPDLSMPAFNAEMLQVRDYSADLLELAERGSASNICQQLIRQLNAFNNALDHAHEVGVCVIGVGGQGITFRPTDLEAWDPSLIIIFGQSISDERPVQVVQHVSQLSVAFITVERTDPAQPKRPIGFHKADRPANRSQEGSAAATQR